MPRPQGRVDLVGAGPGAPQYLTEQARQTLVQAEVVVYDTLVDPQVLHLVRSDCLCLPTAQGNQHLSQTDINRLLVAQCQAGRRVVRLKSGDPFIFGKAQPELAALRAQDCSFSVVPGLSTALAAPVLAGIPLTDARYSQAFAVVTGHNPEALDWPTLARLETLVILMGGQQLQTIVARLRGQRPADTPIAVIHAAGRPTQRVWMGTLADILRQTDGESLAPAVIVVGEVVNLRHQCLPTLPLAGRTILVTRAVDSGGQFQIQLRDLGAQVLEMPVLEVTPPPDPQPLDAALAQLPTFDWLLLTSAQAVDAVLERLLALGYDTRHLHGVRIGVVGEKTAQHLQRWGLQPDFTPPEFVADALLTHFPDRDTLAGRPILFPRVASGGREVLTQGLRALGAIVTEVAAYETCCPDQAPPLVLEQLAAGRVDAVTFTSSKTVRHFCRLLSQANSDWQTWIQSLAVAAIGPQTARTCEEYFGRVDVQAETYTLEGLTTALVEHFTSAP